MEMENVRYLGHLMARIEHLQMSDNYWVSWQLNRGFDDQFWTQVYNVHLRHLNAFVNVALHTAMD